MSWEVTDEDVALDAAVERVRKPNWLSSSPAVWVVGVDGYAMMDDYLEAFFTTEVAATAWRDALRPASDIYRCQTGAGGAALWSQRELVE